jgi:hypothetical protein
VHLVEMVSKEGFTSSEASYPQPDTWHQIDDSVWTAPITANLGYALDPSEKFTIGSVHSNKAGWDDHDRTLFCYIGQLSLASEPLLTPFTGVVRGQDQEMIVPPATCLVAASATQVGSAVPCSAPHTIEVTGTMSLQGLAALPQGSAAMSSAVGTDCISTAEGYVGGPLPPAIRWGWLYLAQTSWDAGERTVNCTVLTLGSSGVPVATKGSLAHSG